MPVLYMLASLPCGTPGIPEIQSFSVFLLTLPSSGRSQLQKCGPASIRSMIPEWIPLLGGRQQQPSAKVRCQKGNPCAGLSQMVAHPSCSWGSGRAGSSCQRELQLLCRMGMGARGRKHLPAAPRSPQLVLCLSHGSFFQWERCPGESPVWEGESGNGRKSPVGLGCREAHFGCGRDLESSRCQTSSS